ncbi:MAG: hypothetical protein IPL53_24155 [Ignavibacteria bacterium]|nr:hypothetical protein [Ignavibacteria bacterium]
MKKTDMTDKIRILNEIIRESMESESEGNIISLIVLSARAELSLRGKKNEINSGLENEIIKVIQKYKKFIH